MSGRLRVALAGAGMVSRHHLSAWSKLAGAEVVAIADRDGAKGRERASTFGLSEVFEDVGTMLDTARPDALDIATPVTTHLELLQLAASRGVAALCQKPLASSFREAEAAGKIADRIRVMVNENWRFRAPYRLAQGWIGSGRIGRVRRFAVSAQSSGLVPREAGGLPPALVRQPFLADLPRLVIFELLTHHLDVSRALCGELEVRAAALLRSSPCVKGDDRATILCVGDGVFGTVTGDFAVVGRPAAITDAVEVIGESGRVEFDGATIRLLVDEGEAERRCFGADEVYQSGFDTAIEHFAACLGSGAPFETSIADNLRTLRLVDDSYSSAEMDLVGSPL